MGTDVSYMRVAIVVDPLIPEASVSGTPPSGFVGTAIRNSLLEQFTVRGLTRSAYKLSHPDPNDPVQWVHCNAYSASSVEQALQGTDYLIYLIHSMVPSSRLTQASFQDLDLLLADNFAQGAKALFVLSPPRSEVREFSRRIEANKYQTKVQFRYGDERARLGAQVRLLSLPPASGPRT